MAGLGKWPSRRTRRGPDLVASRRYEGDAGEQPLRASLFTVEQLEVHARALAGSHTLRQRRGRDRLLARLNESEDVITEGYELVAEASASGRRLAPAAEWLLDNHYLVREQIRLARRHFPPGYSRQLPRLQDGELAGNPRIYDLILQLISHVDGRVDTESLTRYIAAYQSVKRLNLGELWAVPIMLRLALIENLRRVTAAVVWRRVHRDRGLLWATRINEAAGKPNSAVVLVLADLVRADPPLSTPFVAEFTQAIQGRGPAMAFVLAWLEQRLAQQGRVVEEMVRAEGQGQAADQVSMANSIVSLRFVNATDWHEFVEAHSAAERNLRRDPAGVYGRMDFATRDAYRHVVEKIAQRLRISEEHVACTAVEVAATRHAEPDADIFGHVGYYLLDAGKRDLLRALRGRPPARQVRERRGTRAKLALYLLALALVTALAALPFVLLGRAAPGLFWVPLAICGLLAASQCAVAAVNWCTALVRRPRPLPRLNFESGIPAAQCTAVVVPAMLASEARIEEMADDLELRYLANRSANLWFCLLTDWLDAPAEHVAADQPLLAAAVRAIERLNEKYGAADDSAARAPFFLLHRPRIFNPREGCWMGRERKRGKLEDFNTVLREGARRAAERFCRVVGDLECLSSVRYVITLDADTALPWGAGWRLVGAAAHPLNRALLDPDRPRLRRGYVILQPRVGISLRSARQSLFAHLMSGDVGLDPYTRVVSDLYQDLFHEASFIGKGLYDITAFHRLLDGRFPPNTILSHDLLESCYARCALVSDVELIEDHPSRFLADADRRHRWMRGDWQIAPWLGPRVRDARGHWARSCVSALGRWKILDNLRRTLLPAAQLALLCLGWLALPSPGLWAAWVLFLLLLPELLPALQEWWQKPADSPVWLHFSTAARSSGRRLARFTLALAVLPFEAWLALDAIIRTAWRMLFSRRRLLEWQTAAAAEHGASLALSGIARRMWFGPVLAVAAAALLSARGLGWIEAAAAVPVLALWLCSPVLVWWISRPLRSRGRALDADDVLFVRRAARMTWRFFEDLVGPHENWLPPDNLQEHPYRRVAHRTSPTNVGLSLLANLAACDLHYLSVTQLLARTSATLESLEQLERHRGHFYNWYDTLTRKPIRPFYISSVDSGNFIGHLAVLRQGLLELAARPLSPPALAEGLHDTLRVLERQVQSAARTPGMRGGPEQRTLRWAAQLLGQTRDGLASTAAWLRDFQSAAVQIAGTILPDELPEGSWWAHALVRQAEALLEDLQEIAPWALLPVDACSAATRDLLKRLDTAATAADFLQVGEEVSRLIPGARSAPEQAVLQAARAGIEALQARLRTAEALAQRCADLGEADFSFLYNRSRKLLALGYNVAERRLDASHYDLLASEARLVSYLAIALGQLPAEHWFALGRSLTIVHRLPALLSWSGSMFEYLMPLLIMPLFEGTLLEMSCRAAVRRQAEYGRQRGVPWGISESGYALMDVEGNYQYRAFGVPGLGLQRGLSDDLVIAPYATALALLVDPGTACRNLRRLAADGYGGAYGYYEAVDFTPARLPANQTHAVVRSFMAHHQGMSLVAMAQAVRAARMQERFIGNAELRAADLLLQERAPRGAAPLQPHERETEAYRQPPAPGAAPAMRVFNDPSGALPEVHLLSNGRYHVCISAAGGGYSRWNELALTRWRADPTADCWGVFCYVSDELRKQSWSAAHQPVLRSGRDYEAIFTPGRAEFRRLDEQLETHTEIAVSPEDDLEIRRFTLTNRSDSRRKLVVTVFAEAVLAPQASDELHPAFSNLFVETEIEPESNAILLSRRPRSADEQPPWLFCMFRSADGAGPCSFETDRNLFIGRGRSARAPAALDRPGPLAGTQGAVLDPCLAARCPLELGADQSARVDLILGAAPTREAALALLLKYRDPRLADRACELAATHGRVGLEHLGVSEAQAQLFGRLAAAVIYPLGAFRAPPTVLRRNRQGLSGLWGYGISGDHPIVLLRVADTANLRLVQELLLAHAYWRLRGVTSDLVILNEDASGYRQALHDQIMSLISAGTEAQLVDKPGGIFVRHGDHIAEEDRVLLQALARVVIADADGPLDVQVARRALRAELQPGLLLPVVRRPAAHPEQALPRTDLRYHNGFGGFTHDGREYIVTIPADRATPAPWVNVIANPRLGTVVTESGSAYTWFENAQLFRLTPWNNDPVTAAGGEHLFVRDDATGQYFSATPAPRTSHRPYTCRHGFGYSIFTHRREGLDTQLTTYVAVDAPVKFIALKLKNNTNARRTLSVLASFELVLGDLRARHALHGVTELDSRTGAILAHNKVHPDFGAAVTFLDCSETTRTVSGDRAEVLGRNGDWSRPAAMRLRRLSGRLGPALDPCAAMLVRVELAEGEERQVVFTLGAGRDMDEATELIGRYRDAGAARVALEAVWAFWNDKLGIIYAETPDSALNVLMNGWLPYQVLSCRYWGRSGFYQSGGAWGFRDQLQDCAALLHEAPDLAREHLLRCAARMFPEGDVQHWWHPPSGRGVRTTCSDDYLWLPYVLCRYVKFTGDSGVLDEVVGYLSGRPLRPGEESYYDLPGRAEPSDTLYEHCRRALHHALREEAYGPHGLPLIGSGDWNDGMNRVGVEGRGESVWLAFFLHHVLQQFAPLAQRRGDASFAERCLTGARELATVIELHGWDGAWYRRAYFDDGTPLGSSQNSECRIDLLPQSWSVIAGVGDDARRRSALDAVWQQLVRHDLGVILLLTPPFDNLPLDPGYIRGYVPGVRENGGQYTHAAIWATIAFALSGRVEQAFTLLRLLNPIYHGGDARRLAQYKVEPYAIAADVYSSPQHGGRGGWTWYTGSAGWFYRLLHEIVLGLERQANQLRFRPCVPPDWREYKVHYRYYQTFYHITFHQDDTRRGQVGITLDGQEIPGDYLELINDMREHQVAVRFAPVAGTPPVRA